MRVLEVKQRYLLVLTIYCNLSFVDSYLSSRHFELRNYSEIYFTQIKVHLQYKMNTYSKIVNSVLVKYMSKVKIIRIICSLRK